MVDDANLVQSSEKKIFTDILKERGLDYVFFEKLTDALKYVLESSAKTDTILLIGAQGMDPANNILKDKFNLQ